MKKTIQFIALVFLLTLIQYTGYTQVREVEPNQTEQRSETSFTNRLWYGGGVILGFSGGSYESLFQIGVSPMVGYKIFEPFSIGPRASIAYFSYRESYTGRVQKTNAVIWAIGAFARYKIIRNIFLHTEAELENAPYAYDNGQLLRRQRNNLYVGGGYNSGERLGYEIMLLYNLNLPENELQSPLDIRVGFTYNF